MPELKNIMALPIKDQLVICVTDALMLVSRHLECIPRFGDDGRLSHIECWLKQNNRIKPVTLVIHYNAYGDISSIGDHISVDASDGGINYEHVHNELTQLICAYFPPQILDDHLLTSF